MLKRYIVDSNVVLRFLLADDDKQSPLARSYFMDETNQLIIPILVFCEVVWVMKKRSKIPNEKIALLLNSLVANERVIYDSLNFTNGMKFLQKGGDFADGVIAHLTYQFDNAILLTFDKNSSKIANQFNIANTLLKNTTL